MYNSNMAEKSFARLFPDPNTGLTKAQIQNRIENGLVNTQPPGITKTAGQILRENLCTFFNALNFGLAICLLLVKSYSNLLFMGVVLCNLLIGTVQQLRSKKTVERLSVLYAPKARAIRDGVETSLPVDRLVLDDVIRLKLGDQIPADAILIAGDVEVNEALLTGEPDAIAKQSGDLLLSGSFVVSGECRARVERLGEENYATRIAQEARKYKKVRSNLMRSLQRIIHFTGGAVLPLGVLLFSRAYFLSGHTLQSAVEQTAGSMIGMIPSGLMLLTSVTLAVGVMTLTKKKTLVQEMYSIETLSRVDMLCLDKTGTLTAGQMEVTAILHPDENMALETQGLIADFCGALPEDNTTATALISYCRSQNAQRTREAMGILPFSSERKYSAAAFPGVGVLYLGAMEFLRPRLPDQLVAAADQYAKNGSRVLVFALDKDALDPKAPPREPEALCLVLLSDTLRPEAKQTLGFFISEGVNIKLISGDDPRTVSGVARRLSLTGSDKWVDASTLLDEAAVKAAATNYVIFGRVSPQQKRWLVEALKEAGHTVAMTGDGVNDVLALKEADCSIALNAGSDAARQVSHLVLLDDDFASLPAVVMEGRRVINNITRTASLFLVKTIFSFLLTVCSVFFGIRYPFQPVQLSLISALTIGIPSFVLALEPNRIRITGDFLKNVLARALPGAILVFLYSIIANTLGPLVGLNHLEVSTLCVYLTGCAGLCVLLKVSLPINWKRAALFVCMTLGFLLGAYYLRRILDIGLPVGRILWLLLPMAAGCYPLLMGLSKFISLFLLRNRTILSDIKDE